MNSEKVKEIKKALEVYCKENKGITILHSGEIQTIPYADILTLINELENGIDELAKQVVKITGCSVSNEEVDYECNKKLKQFAERLKEKYGKSCSEYYPILIEMTSDEIDELLKEYE